MMHSNLFRHILTGDARLTHKQWMAFIRQCMCDCGLDIHRDRYRTYMRDQELHGQFLRNFILPPLLSKYTEIDPLKYKAIARHDPYLWKRLAGAMAFGYAQGRVLFCFRFSGDDEDGWVAKAAMLFNTTIMLYDYLVDEKGFSTEGKGGQISEMVRQLLVGDVDQGLFLADRMAGAAKDSLLHLLICLMAAWVRFTRASEDFTIDTAAWQYVKQLIYELFKAEVAVSSMRMDPWTLSGDEMDLVAMKSTGPSVAIAWMTIAGAGNSETPPNKTLLDMAQIIGEIFWLVDDLIDAMRDMERGNPNRLLLNVMDSHRYSSGDIDTDILKKTAYTECEQIIRNLAQLEETASIDLSNSSQRVALDNIREFMHMYVLDWLQLVPE
jgi:hypothetical protein